MRVTLIFPPATDPRSPHLALPCLAAVLRNAGVDVELLDLDIGGLVALLDFDHLTQAGARVQQKCGSTSHNHDEPLKRMAAMGNWLPGKASEALAILRDREKFYDSNEFNTARETIFNCLDLVSAAAPKGPGYNLFPVSYKIDGVDMQSLGDLIRAADDRDVNLFADYWETEVFPHLKSRNPDLIGITITNAQQVIPGLTLARQLRKRGHFVILGGTVYTKFVNELAKNPAFFEHFADGVVVYEGETALLELAHQLEGNWDFDRVPNYLYLRQGVVRFTRTHVEDVNALPTPDFSGLPLHLYLTPETVLPILFGKGCYFNRCKFCDIPYINRISTKAYRIRSPSRIVGDLINLYGRYGCRHFEFTDEALAPKLLVDLAEALEPCYRHGFCFVGYARLEPSLTSEVCRKLARMGMRKLFFGLESGAQETVDHMDKGIRISDVPVILKNCRDAGIDFHVFSIVGFPQESETSARKTCQFFIDHEAIINHPGNSFDIHPFGLDLRTRYYHESEQLGIQIAAKALTKDFVIGVGDQWTNTRGMTREQVEDLLTEFNLLLRRVYSSFHATDQNLWPAFEEYAILYADWYGKREFPYRTSLPAHTDPRRYRLRWNPAALVEVEGGAMLRVSSRYGHVEIDRTSYELLGREGFRRIPEMLAELCSGDAEDSMTRLAARQIIDDLIKRGLLQVEPHSLRGIRAKKDGKLRRLRRPPKLAAMRGLRPGAGPVDGSISAWMPSGSTRTGL